MFRWLIAGSIGLVLLVFGVRALDAQVQFQLAPTPPGGHFVAPWFEGWYANPDGTFTFSYGFMNRNRADTLEVPLGPDNYIEPAQFDGLQPTTFVPGRQPGVFGITVPAGFTGDVVWHLRTHDDVKTVPGRNTSFAYELAFHPMAMGSVPPVLRFEPSGEAARGPEGLIGPPKQTQVDTALDLTVWVVDESVREREAPVGLNWYKHQGPGRVSFLEADDVLDAEGRATATVSFSEPGEYMIRVRANNFRAPDSTTSDQCCWTNGFFRVTVQ
jgi:hypothetical protein